MTRPAELHSCENDGCARMIFYDERHLVGSYYVCNDCRDQVVRELSIEAFGIGLAFGAAGADIAHAEENADVHEDFREHFRKGFGSGERARLGNMRGYWQHVLGGEVRECRVCKCSEFDCSGCVARTGQACSWIARDLCSACAPAATASEESVP